MGATQQEQAVERPAAAVHAKALPRSDLYFLLSSDPVLGTRSVLIGTRSLSAACPACGNNSGQLTVPIGTPLVHLGSPDERGLWLGSRPAAVSIKGTTTTGYQ